MNTYVQHEETLFEFTKQDMNALILLVGQSLSVLLNACLLWLGHLQDCRCDFYFMLWFLTVL